MLLPQTSAQDWSRLLYVCSCHVYASHRSIVAQVVPRQGHVHCQKFGSKWRTRVRIESLMAAKSCKEMYGISTKIQNTTTTSYNIP